MSAHFTDSNVRPAPDAELVAIADFVTSDKAASDEAYETARYCLMDSLGCAMLALQYPACVKHLGTVVAGTTVPGGVRVPGTGHQLDPIKAAFDISCTIRWLDYNDTWLAAEWGHPSDNLGAILAVADYLCRRNPPGANAPGSPRIRDVLTATIQAHEIQGVLALENSFNRVGLDHVILVKVASTAVATRMLGGTKAQIIDALSHAWIDGQSLRTYRHAPNTGPRKSWAAGDATSRAVRLALMTLNGEPGLPSALTAPKWGFHDVLFKGNPLKRSRSYGSYVMENVLFKISFPAEFHAQTAAECAMKLHPLVKDRLDQIDRIEIATQESAVRIISKTGPLHNPADRDHCIQYITAIPLIFGRLTADDYEDKVARDPRIDALRDKMHVVEDPRYTREYLEAAKRSIANAVQVFFKDGTKTDKVEAEYPIGHRRRRAEGMPLLVKKFEENIATQLPAAQAKKILEVCQDRARLEAMPVDEFMAMWVIEGTSPEIPRHGSGLTPVVRYMIVCNDWGIDAKNCNRINIFGLAANIYLKDDSEFPVIHPQICVLLALTEIRGLGRAFIRCVYEETGEVAFQTSEFKVQGSSDPLRVVAVPFRIRHCTFPGLGMYSVQFWYNEALIEERPLVLRSKP